MSLENGWLTKQAEIRISVFNNPVKIWGETLPNRSCRIKCSVMDLRFEEVMLYYVIYTYKYFILYNSLVQHHLNFILCEQIQG